MASFILYIAWIITSSQAIVSKLSNTDAIFYACTSLSERSFSGPISNSCIHHRLGLIDSPNRHFAASPFTQNHHHLFTQTSENMLNAFASRFNLPIAQCSSVSQLMSTPVLLQKQQKYRLIMKITIHKFRTLDSNTNNTASLLIPLKPYECALIHVPHHATPHAKSDTIALHDPIQSRFEMNQMITNGHNKIWIGTSTVPRYTDLPEEVNPAGTKPKELQSASMEERETPSHIPHSKEHDTHHSDLDQLGNVYDVSAISFSLFHLCRLLSSIIFIIYLNKQIKGFVVIICMAFTFTSSSALTMSLGCVHTCASSDCNTMKCFGGNLDGSLGYGDEILRGGNANEMGANLPEVDLGTGFDVAQIATGCVYTCSLSTSNKVKCWGRNTLGYGDEIHRGDNANEMGDFLPEVDLGTGFNVRQIVTGYFHACVISTLNTIKCWGSGYAGRLGYGDTNDRGENPNEMGDYLPEVDLGTEFDVLMIATGWQHTCALSTSNKVKCFGRNNYGQLGLGKTNNRGDHANEMGDNLPEIDLGSGFVVTQISAGRDFTCALSTSNKVKCFGRNNYGQLGLANTNNRGDNANEMGDNLPEIDLGSGFVVTQIAVGGTTVCALSTLYTVKCWGRSGLSGQLGYGDTTTRGDNANEMGDYLPEVDLGTNFNVEQIAISHDDGGYTCAVSMLNTVKCWGYGGYGQLGYGDYDARGSKANQMGDNLPLVDIGQCFATRHPTAATAVPSYSPSLLPSQYPSLYPSQYPSQHPTISSQHPSQDPTDFPSVSPSQQPSMVPTHDPSISPSQVPSQHPSQHPTSDPTIDPTIDPTADPTIDPTVDPSADPTVDPTANPTDDPTVDPTSDPTTHPTIDPTVDPSADPTVDPTVNPTADPTVDPTVDPTINPTEDPTVDPTIDPTIDPTVNPTVHPTIDPTIDPTADPTVNPTVDPTINPTGDPTIDPTVDPSINPTLHPTITPTRAPSFYPTFYPSNAPTFNPTFGPTSNTYTPSMHPTSVPTFIPTIDPTHSPTTNPTITPTKVPTNIPTFVPSVSPTPTCHSAKYKRVMSSSDFLWGGESFVSANCEFLLTMETSGNLVFQDVNADLFTQYDTWSTNTSGLIYNHSGESVVKMILADGSIKIMEYLYRNVPSIEPIELWSSRRATNIKKRIRDRDIMLYVTDEACLTLNTSANGLWHICLSMQEHDGHSSSLQSTTEFVESVSSEQTEGRIKSKKHDVDPVWLVIGICVVVLAMSCMVQMYCCENGKWRTVPQRNPDTSMHSLVEGDCTTTERIEMWLKETAEESAAAVELQHSTND